VPRLIDRLAHVRERRFASIGSATIWGGMIGGLFGDIAKTEDGGKVLVPASITATAGSLGAYAVTRTQKLTPRRYRADRHAAGSGGRRLTIVR